ncbi:MAG: hypothetical protein ACKV22_12415 [Bryobacteraceae bacterium]
MLKNVKRIKPCAVCRHEAREGIERAVQRHKKNHLAGEMASVLKEQSGQRMSWLMEEWHALRSETVALDAELREQKKRDARLKGLAAPEPPDRPGEEVGGDAAADAGVESRRQSIRRRGRR